MKNAFILLTFGLLAFAVFTGIGTAEEKGGEKMVWKSYDISQLFVYDFLCSSKIQGIIEREEYLLSEGFDVYEIIEGIRDRISNSVLIENDEDVHWGMWLTYSGQLWVSCPQKSLPSIDRIIAGYLTRRLHYDVRLALFRKDITKHPQAEIPKPDDFGGAISVLLDNGYEAVSDIETSLITDKWAYISELSEDLHVADYEGLIASAASILDPIINTLISGLDSRLRIVERENGLELEMKLFFGVLKGFDRITTNGLPIEKPRFVYKKFERLLRFSGECKPLGRTEFRYAGYDNVLLVSVK